MARKRRWGEWPPCVAVQRYQFSLCFLTAFFCSYYITQDSLSLMFTVLISVFSPLKREIRFSEANPTKGKWQDSSREGGGIKGWCKGGGLKMRGGGGMKSRQIFSQESRRRSRWSKVQTCWKWVEPVDGINSIEQLLNAVAAHFLDI